MKKIISVLLVLCIATMFTAYAAEDRIGVTMREQDGLAFTLMENRQALVDDDLRTQMQKAYDSIHATLHFSELAAAGHENGIAQDIDQELAEMGLSLTAYDYLIYDSFDLQLDAAYADKMSGGASLEVVFDLNLDREVKPLVLVSKDAESWKCVDNEDVTLNGDQMTVRFDELGIVLVLIDVAHGAADDDASTGNFTPSVSGKAAPDLITPEGAAEGIIARIYDENDVLISEVPDEGWLVVTPVSRRNSAEDKEVRERLEWAYNQIQTTKRLGDLTSENGTGIADGINAVLTESGFNDLTSDDMIVRDLFDASLYGDEYLRTLNDEGHYIELRFDLKMNANDPLVILITNDNKTWRVLDWSDYTVNADGSVTLYLDELGVIAVLVDSEEQTIEKENAAKSPKTGE